MNETTNQTPSQSTTTPGDGVLLKKQHNLADFCSEDESRYALRGVHYNKTLNRLEATDGRMVIIVPLAKEPVSTEFPPCHSALKSNPQDCIIPVAAIEAAFRDLVEHCSRTVLPVLGTILLKANGETLWVNSQRVSLTVSDLDAEHTTNSKCIESAFPVVQNVVPTFEAKAVAHFQPKYLKKVCEYAEYIGATSIKFELSGNPYDPVRMTIPHCDGDIVVVLMPMRMS